MKGIKPAVMRRKVQTACSQNVLKREKKKKKKKKTKKRVTSS